jgi:acyl phosphate:glycerol-3-phosphate acyltransferase
MIIYIISAIVAYALGSVPSAYLIVKMLSGKDVRREGSGNVGAMNSYEITGNKFIGFYVFLGDFAKGILAVLIAKLISGDDFFAISLAAVFAVLGHNFSIFLRFNGGRGLASAFGAMFLINPFPGVLWLLMWLFTRKAISKDVHVCNAIATLSMPFLVVYTPEDFLKITNIGNYFDKIEFFLLVLNISIVILIRHYKPIKKIIMDYRNAKNDD